uniref:Uncharacterized protein n=1 Tax=Pakpunavirus sp. TaxID=2833053 RepID=A0AB39BYF1_9CAUD
MDCCGQLGQGRRKGRTSASPSARSWKPLRRRPASALVGWMARRARLSWPMSGSGTAQPGR